MKRFIENNKDENNLTYIKPNKMSKFSASHTKLIDTAENKSLSENKVTTTTDNTYLELLFLTVFAFPNASRTGLDWK